MIETKLELANVIAECQKSRFSIRLYINYNIIQNYIYNLNYKKCIH